MKPWEFWRLTPGEYSDMCEGYNLRAEREMERLAWHAANVINVHLRRKDRVTPKKLLGKEKPPMTQTERAAEFEKLKQKIAKIEGS